MTDDITLKEVHEELTEIKKWSRLQGLEALKRVIEGFDDQDKIVYNNADGDSTTTEIGEPADLGNSAVSNRMKQWRKIGIVYKDGQQWKHLAPLQSLGIDEPDLEK